MSKSRDISNRSSCPLPLPLFISTLFPSSLTHNVLLFLLLFLNLYTLSQHLSRNSFLDLFGQDWLLITYCRTETQVKFPVREISPGGILPDHYFPKTAKRKGKSLAKSKPQSSKLSGLIQCFCLYKAFFPTHPSKNENAENTKELDM